MGDSNRYDLCISGIKEKELGRWRVDVILPIVSERQIYQGKVWEIYYTNYMYCQYCFTPRYDLVAIRLIASDTTIHICPCCIYDLYRLPIHFVWDYA